MSHRAEGLNDIFEHDVTVKENLKTTGGTIQDTPTAAKDIANKAYVDASGGAPEGTAVLSTGEGGGTKFLREDGDGTCSWQTAAGAGDVSAAANLTDETIVQGDGGAKGVKTSAATVTQIANAVTHYGLTNEHIDWTNASDNLETTGTITGLSFHGDGSALTGVGEASATALTILAKAGENIDKGEIVYVSGVTGNMPQVSLADNTDAAKHWVIGMAAETKTSGQNILIRARGEVTTINTNSFEAGDTLYLSTGGAMVNAAPTSGAIEVIGYVTVKSATVGEVVLMHHSPHNITVPSGDDTMIRMGDSVGANKCYFKDYANNEVAAVDSNGNITTSGTVDGIDIATDVAANTLKETDVDHNTVTNITVVEAPTNVDIQSSDGSNDTIAAADETNAGVMTTTMYDNHILNNAKNTNVTTNLSLGSGNATTEVIACSDGTDCTLVEADTDNAGLLGADKWDEIVANTAAKHTQNTDTALGSGAVSADHGTAATDQVVNVCYGTGSPPTANTTTIGALFVKYTA